MKIVIDALGSDLGPSMVAEALKLAWKERKFETVLVGPEKELKELLKNPSQPVEYIDSKEFIDNNDAPAMAIRRKKNSSMVLGLKRLNDPDCDVFLSAGSTGALLSGASLITRRVPGLLRCFLGVLMPKSQGKPAILADAGANMDTSPEMLLQFAIVSSLYAEKVMKIQRPKIGLLSVGSEAHKGDQRTQKAFELLKNSHLNFVGNVEARNILDAPADVIITDGFSGNVAVKSTEGALMTALKIIQDSITANYWSKLGGLLILKSFYRHLAPFNYKNHGGAPLLGARKPIYKAHGNSEAKTFALAIQEALDFSGGHMEEEVERALKSRDSFFGEDGQELSAIRPDSKIPSSQEAPF